MNGIDIKFKKKSAVNIPDNFGYSDFMVERAYKSPYSKFLISVEKSTPKLSVMS